VTRKPAKPVRKPYGYGIVGKTGKPWWDESCVCQDRAPLLDTVDLLNEAMLVAKQITGTPLDCDQPYRVVRLFYETRKR